MGQSAYYLHACIFVLTLSAAFAGSTVSHHCAENDVLDVFILSNPEVPPDTHFPMEFLDSAPLLALGFFNRYDVDTQAGPLVHC